MKNLSVNVRNCALSLKVWLVETLLSFQKYNMIMPGLNMEISLIILKFKTVMMFGINKKIRNFLIKSAVNIKTFLLLMMI